MEDLSIQQFLIATFAGGMVLMWLPAVRDYIQRLNNKQARNND